jgi:hypothetical protein
MEEPLHELKHEPWPGYRTAFYITFAVLTIYLVIIILAAPDGGATAGHH